MTAKEMKFEFEIGYNAIASMSAPGIDDYELSVYLTKAQEELVKDYYNPLGNKYQSGFENSEKRRSDLKELVVDLKTDEKVETLLGISKYSQFFKIPTNVFLPIFESCDFADTDCDIYKGVTIYVKSHDEYNIQIANPFKNPDNQTVWRLNLSSIQDEYVVELISTRKIAKYNLRYIKFPEPIIITNLNTAFPGQGLSIDGSTLQADCKLYKGIHREIVDRAIELSLRDYKEAGLSSKVQLDTRNE